MSSANSGYVYKQAEPELFIVGHYAPDGDFEADSEHATPDAAANRVHFLNGGRDDDKISRQLHELQRRVKSLERKHSLLFA